MIIACDYQSCKHILPFFDDICEIFKNQFSKKGICTWLMKLVYKKMTRKADKNLENKIKVKHGKQTHCHSQKLWFRQWV